MKIGFKWLAIAIIIICLLPVLLLVALNLEDRLLPKKTCEEYSQTDVISKIKTDFLNGLPNYPSMRDRLGTTRPQVQFNKKIASDPDVIALSYFVTGPYDKVEIVGIFTCANEGIEYSIEPE